MGNLSLRTAEGGEAILESCLFRLLSVSVKDFIPVEEGCQVGARYASPLQYNTYMNVPDPRPPRQPIPYRTSVFVRIANYLKLFIRLLLDPRVSILLKLIPFGALVYGISPLDWAIPVVDDLVILFLGIYLFVELCPENIVKAHRQAIEGVLEGQARDAQDDEKIAEEDILEGEFHDDP